MKFRLAVKGVRANGRRSATKLIAMRLGVVTKILDVTIDFGAVVDHTTLLWQLTSAQGA
jgi:hypothetical protein